MHECLHQEPLPAVHIVLVVRDLRTGRIETGINIEIRGSRTEIRRSLTFNRRSSRLFASIRLLIVATKLVVARALTCYTFVAEIATKKIEGRRLTGAFSSTMTSNGAPSAQCRPQPLATASSTLPSTQLNAAPHVEAECWLGGVALTSSAHGGGGRGDSASEQSLPERMVATQCMVTAVAPS